MIGVNFQAPELSFTSGVVPMPMVPRIGDQIFLGDFITEDEESEILSKNERPNIDSLFVRNVTWLRSQKQKEVYVLVVLYHE